MRFKTVLFLTFLALPFAGASAADQPLTGSSPKAGETRDAGFIQKAGAAGLAEVKLGQLAARRASSPDVKKFAQQMVDAHTASNKELGLIAARQHQKMPAQMDGDHVKLNGKLEGQSGPEFDRTYLKAMVADHEKMATLLESAKGTGSAEVQKFARNTLPAVQEHLAMAKSLLEKH
jgi:putative membrane protein